MKSLDELIIEALENARKDREIAESSFEKMKDALSLEDEDDLQKTMLVGDKPIKLIEQMTRSNEQIVRLAQILEKRESRKKEEKRQPINLAELKKAVEQKKVEVRVEEEVPSGKTKKRTRKRSS